MAYDVSRWGRYAAPGYIQTEDANSMGHALYILQHGGLPPNVQNTYDPTQRHNQVLAARMYRDIYQPFLAKNKGMSGASTGLATWANQYWDWLRGGAQQRVATPATSTTTGDFGKNALHYIAGQGYVTEADLQDSDPEQYAAIQAARAAEVKNAATVNPYYEAQTVNNPAGTAMQKHTGWAGKAYGAKGLSAYPAVSTEPYPAGTPDQSGGGAGNANRNGNYATSSVPGQTAVTSAVGMAGGGASKQAVQTAAKRAGRSISQAGVTRVPNLAAQYSRQVRKNMRRA